MIFPEKQVVLKNGQKCTLKSPESQDAEFMLRYLKRTSAETHFMMRYEEEVSQTIQEERAYLESLLSDPKEILIAAFLDGEIVAAGGISRIAPFFKYQHRAEFGISIIQSCWHIGIGSAILSEVIQCSKKAGYEQIELEVVADNRRAIALYLKYGFVVYGTRERSFKLKDGTYETEYLMLLRL